MFGRLGSIFLLQLVWLSTALSGFAQVSVLTQHNDLARTGQNLSESILNTSNVNVASFGKLFWRTVDGYVYAQPLYVSNLLVGGKTRNVLYVATEHNSVYAFDADDPAQAVPLWHVNLGTPVPSQDICVISGNTNPQNCPYLDINSEIGITSTPVIDSGIMYVVARTKTGSNGYHFVLHALDITSGAEQPSSPMEITGQVMGNGLGSSNGILAFDPAYHLQRPGLLLMNGVVYIAFGSVGDIGTFHGWMMGYDATTLQQTMIFNVTPNGKDGGIWEAGQGLVGDGLNSIYVMTGNGAFDANSSGRDYGDSILKMDTSSGLVVSDYFTPSNQAALFDHDTDLGSGGPVLLPGTSLVVGIGKDKLFRVVDTTNMGRFNSGFDGDVQEFTASSDDYLGSPVYWDSPNNGPVVYLWGSHDFLTAYKLAGGQFQTTPATQSTVQNSTGFANSAPYTAGTGGGTIKFVQVMAATPQTPSMSVAVTYPGVQTGGNLNVVVVGWDDTTSSVSAVTDSGGNAYVLAVGPVTGSGGRESIYYAKNIAGGSNTVTVTFDHAAVYVDVRVLEYSGLDTANPLDAGGTAQAAGTGTSANSGAATVASGNELLVGAGKTSGRFTAAGTGYSSRIITSPDGDIAEDRIVSSGGSYNATAAVTSSNWVMQIVAFQAQQ